MVRDIETPRHCNMQLSEEDGGELAVAIDNYSRSIQGPTNAVVAIMAAVDVRHLCTESLQRETLSAGTRRSLTQITNQFESYQSRHYGQVGVPEAMQEFQVQMTNFGQSMAITGLQETCIFVQRLVECSSISELHAFDFVRHHVERTDVEPTITRQHLLGYLSEDTTYNIRANPHITWHCGKVDQIMADLAATCWLRHNRNFVHPPIIPACADRQKLQDLRTMHRMVVALCRADNDDTDGTLDVAPGAAYLFLQAARQRQLQVRTQLRHQDVPDLYFPAKTLQAEMFADGISFTLLDCLFCVDYGLSCMNDVVTVDRVQWENTFGSALSLHPADFRQKLDALIGISNQVDVGMLMVGG